MEAGAWGEWKGAAEAGAGRGVRGKEREWEKKKAHCVEAVGLWG